MWFSRRQEFKFQLYYLRKQSALMSLSLLICKVIIRTANTYRVLTIFQARFKGLYVFELI